MESIGSALNSILLTALAAVAAIVSLVGLYVQAFIKKRTKDLDDKSIDESIEASVMFGVKASAQIITNGKRDANGQLPPEVCLEARLYAIKAAKAKLGPERLKAAEARHGCEGLEVVMGTQAEAALYDIKSKTTTATTATSTVKKERDGSTTTTTTQATSTAAEPSPPAVAPVVVVPP